MMFLLLDSALRSLLFGCSAWALLKLLHVRHTGTETIIWTSVLVVALTMPLLSHYLPQWVLVVPYLSAAELQPVSAAGLGAPDGGAPIGLWLLSHARAGLVAAYLLGVLVHLTRLAIGLLQSVRLCVSAARIEANWGRGHHIRVSTALTSPASMARVILLPADYCDWSAVKREAVLAHEGAHIARGDFFVQLLASIHCAFFWFSPFAWWLQSKLAEVAETASDEAAVRSLNDRVTYAEVLLEVARRAQPLPAIIAMAKGPFIEQRVERILSEAPSEPGSVPLRVLIIGCLPLVAIPLASARAAVGTLPAISLAQVQGASSARIEAKVVPSQRDPDSARGAPRPPRHAARMARAVPESPANSQIKAEEVSYNPRALLDSPSVPDRPYVPASTIVHAGKIFYIRSNELPVGSVSDVNEADHRSN